MSNFCFPVRLASLVNRRRVAARLGVRELSRLSGVCHALIGRIESGEASNPRFMDVIQLCKTLGVDDSEIVGLCIAESMSVDPDDVWFDPAERV